jgi:hypothetical protein
MINSMSANSSDEPKDVAPQYWFRAPHTKIDRARKHLAELETEIATYFASNPVKFDVRTAETEVGRAFNVTLHMAPVPECMGAIVGDIIHNLRAALDLTACEMVRVAEQSEDDVYFPFCKNVDELDGMIRRRNFHRAGPSATELLRSLKPYRNGNAALRAVHDLDVHDKHRALIPNAVSASSPIIQLWEDDGTRNPRVIGDPTAPTQIMLVFPASTEFDGREMVPTLHELVQLIEGIVEAFRALANRS